MTVSVLEHLFVILDELEVLSVLIYPNPVSNNLTVDLGDLNGVNTTIKLYDSSSKLSLRSNQLQI